MERLLIGLDGKPGVSEHGLCGYTTVSPEKAILNSNWEDFGGLGI